MAPHRTPAFKTYEEEAETDIDSDEEEDDGVEDTIPRIILFHPNCRCTLSYRHPGFVLTVDDPDKLVAETIKFKIN